MLDLFGTHSSVSLVPPVTYQGGKQRVAEQILDHMDFSETDTFVDVCCGSGAISLALLNRGYRPTDITMIDAGPWGAVWASIGAGAFSMTEFSDWINRVPTDPERIQGFLKELSQSPETVGNVYVFLLLQAGSFGGKAIWVGDNAWKNITFRNYWKPTQTSNRQSVVNPMMPMPKTMYERMAPIIDRAGGVRGIHGDAIAVNISNTSLVYIDPPYTKTTKYGHTLDVNVMSKRGRRCYVSEGRPLSDKNVLISSDRKKGGISGERKVAHVEYLSCMERN